MADKKNAFEKLPPSVQNGIVYGGIGLIAYFLFFRKANPGAQLPAAAASQLQKLAAQGVYPNISAEYAESLASTLRSAFDDCGTDTGAVFSVMQRMTSDADIWLLVQVYGTRGYKGCFDGDYFGNHEYNLNEAMVSELSRGDLNTVNAQLAANSIHYKF